MLYQAFLVCLHWFMFHFKFLLYFCVFYCYCVYVCSSFYVPISQAAISALGRALSIQLSPAICTYVILCLL